MSAVGVNFFGKVKDPCDDCSDGYCTMNCSGRITVEDKEEICECLTCGRTHRVLGAPPWALSHENACRLSRAFNEVANLRVTQDYRINEWLKKLIEQTAKQN